MPDDKKHTGKFRPLFTAVLRPKQRLPDDRTPDGYYRPPPIFHSAFVPPAERPNWFRPHGPRKDRDR